MEHEKPARPNYKHRVKSLALWIILLVVYSVFVTVVLVLTTNALQLTRAELNNLELSHEILLEKAKNKW